MKNIIKPMGKRLQVVANVFNREKLDFYITSIYQSIKKLTGNPGPPSSPPALEQRRTPTQRLDHLLDLAKGSDETLPHLCEIRNILIKYPDLAKLAHSRGIMAQILPMLDNGDPEERRVGSQLLALLGMTPRNCHRGIRILSIDGGGIKGIVSLRILQKMEEMSGKPLTDLFDYVCGVSVGSVVAVGVFGLGRRPGEIVDLFRSEIKEIFSRNSLIGAGKVVFSSSFYNSSVFDRILREHFGGGGLIDLTSSPRSPKLSLLSVLENGRDLEPFSFRNYNPPFGRYSEFRGTADMPIWQAIRASSSVPILFEDVVIGGVVFKDGGLLYNNPTAVALSEARNLWPGDSLHCVVSLGTGRTFPGTFGERTPNPSLLDRCSMIIKCAGDPEPMHGVFRQMMPSSVYYRLNPILSQNIRFEETSEDKLNQLIHDTDVYLRKNEIKLRRLIRRLLEPPTLLQRLHSFIRPKYK